MNSPCSTNEAPRHIAIWQVMESNPFKLPIPCRYRV